MTNTDHTHDPSRTSWIESANAPGADFPVQNLPFGVFSTPADESPRIGVAIGDQVLDLRAAIDAGLLDELDPETRCALHAPSLNMFMALGRDAWVATRSVVSTLLDASCPTVRDSDERRRAMVVPIAEARMHVPAQIGDYTDFYASLHHATNVGSMFRPDNPLMPNWKHLPVGYHGRASSVVIDGTPVRRPKGQTKADDAALPEYGPCRLLDYEMEMGFYVGPGNELGSPIAMGSARDHLFGLSLVNDWSARDVQKWEYQPLGPFNAKNFATTVSPWVVTLEALEPYRVDGPPRSSDDPPTIDYLQPAEAGAYHITVEVHLRSQAMREQDMPAMLISRGDFFDMYWTMSQMLVHHASTGCNMKPGDLLASGTISGPTDDSRGCLLERTWRGRDPLHLPDGTQRTFLQDGDEVILTGYAQREGAARIGLGRCRGIVLPAG